MTRYATGSALAAAMLLLAGCTTMEESLELRKPTAQLVGVRLQDVSAHAATLLFDVDVENHYPVAVPLLNFKYTVSSGGKPFLAGSSELRMELPANGHRTVALPVTIDYLNVLSALIGVQPGATIPYDAQVTLTVNTPRLGPLALSLQRAGDLALPAVSGAGLPSIPGSIKTE